MILKYWHPLYAFLFQYTDMTNHANIELSVTFGQFHYRYKDWQKQKITKRIQIKTTIWIGKITTSGLYNL